MSTPSDLALAAVLCSRNPHKARELQALLPGWTLAPLDRDDYPPETGVTYYDNAASKARYGREHADGWVLAEDSGLSVDALGGRPGVYSARYAPEGAPAIAKLLGELEGAADRRAHYVSEVVLIAPDGYELRGTGALLGRIASEPRGSEGFGYDPIFVPNGEERTVAELGDAWKAEHSHRARAAQALLVALAES
ncbi:MAG TPA: non-canonical purine NTP pyrophosphatase [Gaiellaceae bacterium]|nr:non-canonical purine NTP pyrophosphatase [Gaiellaceae bacterium]